MPDATAQSGPAAALCDNGRQVSEPLRSEPIDSAPNPAARTSKPTTPAPPKITDPTPGVSGLRGPAQLTAAIQGVT
jgi:hypothetical protein